MKLTKNNVFKQRRWQYVMYGLLLSFIGPLGEWIFVNVFSNYINDSFLLTYVYTEIAAMAAFTLFGYIIGIYAEKVEQLAFYDKLTGLYNRHYLMEQLQELEALHKRYEEKFSLILLDLDHFKKVNDSYGHSVGDKTLEAVAGCIIKKMRETDFAARYGGEEFIIVCPHAGVDDCYKLAERIRIGIEQLKEDSLGFPGPQTISAGIYEVSLKQEVSLAQILNNADQAFYRAKQNGRNTIFVYDAGKK